MAKYASGHGTSVELDDEDPEDLKILQRQRIAARDAGKSGRDRAGSTAGRADLESAFDEGARQAASPSVGTGPGTGGAKKKSAPAPSPGSKGSTSKGPSIPRPTLRPPRTPVGGKDWAGFALGLVLHALVVSYIRYGKAGPKGWLAAKFLNKPIQGDDLEHENRKDDNNGVDPAPSGRGPNGEVPAEGHLDPGDTII